MKVFKIRSYAKINLALAILNKRKDGYHNINSIMQTVSLYDIVKLKKNKKIICKTNDITIPNDDSNLAVKAAKAFFSFFSCESLLYPLSPKMLSYMCKDDCAVGWTGSHLVWYPVGHRAWYLVGHREWYLVGHPVWYRGMEAAESNCGGDQQDPCVRAFPYGGME